MFNSTQDHFEQLEKKIFDSSSVTSIKAQQL